MYCNIAPSGRKSFHTQDIGHTDFGLFLFGTSLMNMLDMQSDLLYPGISPLGKECRNMESLMQLPVVLEKDRNSLLGTGCTRMAAPLLMYQLDIVGEGIIV